MIQNQHQDREFEEEHGKITPVCAPVSARGPPATSKGERGTSLLLELQELSSFERRMGLEMIVIFKKQQHEKWDFEMEPIATVAGAPRKSAPSTVTEPSVFVLDDKDDVESGLRVVEVRSSLQAMSILKQIIRLRVQLQRKQMPTRRDRGTK